MSLDTKSNTNEAAPKAVWRLEGTLLKGKEVTTLSDGAAKSILRGSATALVVRRIAGKIYRIQKSGHANDGWSDKKGTKNVSYVEYRICKPSQACSKVEHGGTVKIMTIATKFKASQQPQESLREHLPTRAHLKKTKTHLSDQARTPTFLDGHSGDLCKEMQNGR